jgi:predicted AlkP superfamily phosphohydrolase/phosphomutase
VWRTLATDDADLAAAGYHTVYSGVTAGDHGLFHTFQWQPREQRIRFINALPKPETVWERLARAGRRSLVVDPLLSYRPRLVRGVVLSGWQFSNRIILQRWSRPRSEARRLGRRYGWPRRVEETLGLRSPAHLLRFTRTLMAAPARAVRAATDILGREQFDLLWVNLTPAHFAGHWLLDSTSIVPDASTGERAELDEALPRVYEAVDRALGELVAALPAAADVIVFSPVGMGENASLSEFLPGMLQAILRGERPREANRSSAIWRLRAVLPTRARSAFSQLMPAFVNRALVARLYVHGLDWGSTRAFALPGETHGLVRLNVRGRERDGIVEPGDVPALLDELTASLLAFETPDGRPAVASVGRPRERWPGGTALDALPDLIVGWNAGARAAERLVSASHGHVLRPGVGTGWPGNHVDEAWALLVPAAASVREPSRPPRLVDIAATACELCGVETTGLAGEPLLARPS